MGYGVCNCVRPPTYGICNACGMNFGPAPGPAPIPSPYAPPRPATEIHHYHGLTADEVRQIIREELARAGKESANG